MSDKSDNTFLAFLLGGMIGAVCGILFAPRPGKETRAKLAHMAEDFNDRSNETIAKTKEIAKDVYKEGKALINEGKEKFSSR